MGWMVRHRAPHHGRAHWASASLLRPLLQMLSYGRLRFGLLRPLFLPVPLLPRHVYRALWRHHTLLLSLLQTTRRIPCWRVCITFPSPHGTPYTPTMHSCTTIFTTAAIAATRSKNAFNRTWKTCAWPSCRQRWHRSPKEMRVGPLECLWWLPLLRKRDDLPPPRGTPHEHRGATCAKRGSPLLVHDKRMQSSVCASPLQRQCPLPRGPRGCRTRNQKTNQKKKRKRKRSILLLLLW